MKVELEKLRLGGSPLSDRVYAGTLTPSGKVWREKTDVTNDFLTVAIARWSGKVETIEDEEGKKYEITVKEIK